MYCPNHISSVLHLYASVCAAALLANMENRLFSKPFERFTPSQRYPGLMLNLFGGGSGPLYTGFSVKRNKGVQQYVKKKHGRVLITKFTCSKSASQVSFKLNPFYPNISEHILHTVLDIFLEVLTKTIFQ